MALCRLPEPPIGESPFFWVYKIEGIIPSEIQEPTLCSDISQDNNNDIHRVEA